MNLLNNHNARYFVYLALLTSLLAVLVKFEGIVTVHVTPLGLQVQVYNHSSECFINPENIKPQPFFQNWLNAEFHKFVVLITR